MHLNQGYRKRSKHQHWVPQFYLNCFATLETRDTDRPQVWIFSKNSTDGDERLTNVRNICGKRYLYSPIGEDGNRNWDVDERIDKLESTLGSVWPTLINEIIDLRESTIRKGVSLFIAVMHLRNPEMQKTLRAMHTNIVSAFDKAPKDTDGVPEVKAIRIRDKEFNLDPSDWHQYRDWKPNDHHRFFTEMIEKLASDIAAQFIAKRWSVICSPEDAFITSDKPVALLHQHNKSPGFSTPGAIVHFPLSPKRMLVLDDNYSEPDGQYYSAQQNVAGALNLATWLNTTRFLVTGRNVATVLNEIVPFIENQDSPNA